jgi:hypothetical protein
MKEEFFSERIKSIARDLYTKFYYYFNEITDSPIHGNTREFDLLTKDERKYILQKVRHIPKALRKINYEVISVKEKPESVNFSDKELDILGEYEYRRIHPISTPWNELPSEDKDNITEYIKSWPEILANSYLKIDMH